MNPAPVYEHQEMLGQSLPRKPVVHDLTGEVWLFCPSRLSFEGEFPQTRTVGRIPPGWENISQGSLGTAHP